MKLSVKIKAIMLLIVLIAISACSQHSQVMVKNRECAVPARVQLTVLDNKSHIGSEKNVAILMLNIADMTAYVKSLESSIKCFIDSSPEGLASATSDSSLLTREVGSPRKKRSSE